MMNVKRGEIYIADLMEAEGSVQYGVRPVLVIQNDKGNTVAFPYAIKNLR